MLLSTNASTVADDVLCCDWTLSPRVSVSTSYTPSGGEMIPTDTDSPSARLRPESEDGLGALAADEDDDEDASTTAAAAAAPAVVCGCSGVAPLDTGADDVTEAASTSPATWVVVSDDLATAIGADAGGLGLTGAGAFFTADFGAGAGGFLTFSVGFGAGGLLGLDNVLGGGDF